MATSSRRSNSPQRSDAPRRASGGAPNMVPVFATLAIVLVAAVAVALMNQPKEDDTDAKAKADAAAATATAKDIFGDVDTTVQMPVRGGKGGEGSKTTHNAPPGLADAQVFQDARKIAAEATVLVNDALAAEKAGDVETFRTKAIAGREKLEQTIEMTADWEIDLLDKWGQDEAQLKAIAREIDTWRTLLKKVRKVH